MKGGQNLHVTKIVTAWTVTGTSNRKDWDDQPLFDQSDLHVVPEALIYEIFGGILSSTPSSNE